MDVWWITSAEARKMTSNQRRMRRVLGRTDMRVAEVLVALSGGQTKVPVIGGGTITVSGVGWSAGDRVFIKDNAIRSEAPTLMQVDIDV